MPPALLIAAPTSGCGKTTFTLGLLAALRDRSLRVQPFKCGPDYIDTKFHERVCGRPSINLDTFMASPDHVRELFAHYGADADVCVVEGMMGLFDGYDRDRGSSAEIARVLGIPVVLVVDARSAAYSMAALLSGFVNFRQDIRIAGVIYNKVGSERHRAMLRQVADDLHLTCFGCLPKMAALEQGSRYLGLDFSENTDSSQLAAWVEDNVDVEVMMKSLTPNGLTPGPSPKERGVVTFCGRSLSNRGIYSPLLGRGAGGEAVGGEDSILVARNAEAFSFIYQENLDRFAEVRSFDPETEVPDFSGIDLLYLPGGYPEKHVAALTRNEACRKAIRAFAEAGGRVVAECGGMMYLCRSIVTDDGEWPMCGVLPYSVTARKADRRLSLGYRRFVLDGKEYRGHEFHYTQFLPYQASPHDDLICQLPPSVTQVYNALGEPVPTPVFHHKNVLASYTHLYRI